MLKLEWQVGLRRLPFFTQRLAVALLGLLLVSLALVGALTILWSGSQGSDLPLRPPPRARHPGVPDQLSGVEPPDPPARGGARAPASARSSTSSSSTSSTVARRQAATPGTAPTSSTTTTTTTPPTTRDDPVAPLTVPPVLSTLLR